MATQETARRNGTHRKDVVLALEQSGSAENHSRSFARLLYERFSSISSERDPDARIEIEAVLKEDEPDLDSWLISLEASSHTGDFLVQAMRTPVPPRIDGGRRLKWHIFLIFRMVRYLILLPSLQYRQKSGFLNGARTYLQSLVSGLLLILLMPFLYVLAAAIAVIELRIFRYMGTVLITATVFGVITLLIYLGVGEALFIEAVRGLQEFSASVTEQLDEPTIPEASLFQVLAAGATSLFIGLVYTGISLLKRFIGTFVNLEQDDSDRSDLTRLLSPTHGAEYEAALRARLLQIENEHDPARIYVLSSGTNVMLTYRSLARLCEEHVKTPVTLLTWKATMTEGVTYGMDKLWMILDQHDWSRFQFTAPRSLTWLHLGATWNLLDNFKHAFRSPEGEVLHSFASQPVSSAKALFFANRSTAASVLANVALDESYRQEVRAAAMA